MDKLDLLEIKDLEKFKKTPSRAYKFTVDELVDFFGVQPNSIYSSREHHPTQQRKKEEAEKKGKRFITDKYDKLYAYYKLRNILKSESEETITVSGNKDSVERTLQDILKDGKKYKITLREVENEI